MKSPFVSLLILWISLSAAQAQIKVLNAYYGRLKPERTVDVKDVVQAKVNFGATSFPVGPSTMGGNPNPGRPNFLIVEYYAYGQKYTGRAEDGQLFVFRGVGSPAAAADSRLRFENGYGRVVYLYELNRWGAWTWKAQLDPGAVYATNAHPGDVWSVTDRKGQTLQQVNVPRGLGTVHLR